MSSIQNYKQKLLLLLILYFSLMTVIFCGGAYIAVHYARKTAAKPLATTANTEKNIAVIRDAVYADHSAAAHILAGNPKDGQIMHDTAYANIKAAADDLRQHVSGNDLAALNSFSSNTVAYDLCVKRLLWRLYRPTRHMTFDEIFENRRLAGEMMLELEAVASRQLTDLKTLESDAIALYESNQAPVIKFFDALNIILLSAIGVAFILSIVLIFIASDLFDRAAKTQSLEKSIGQLIAPQPDIKAKNVFVENTGAYLVRLSRSLEQFEYTLNEFKERFSKVTLTLKNSNRRIQAAKNYILHELQNLSSTDNAAILSMNNLSEAAAEFPKTSATLRRLHDAAASSAEQGSELQIATQRSLEAITRRYADIKALLKDYQNRLPENNLLDANRIIEETATGATADNPRFALINVAEQITQSAELFSIVNANLSEYSAAMRRGFESAENANEIYRRTLEDAEKIAPLFGDIQGNLSFRISQMRALIDAINKIDIILNNNAEQLDYMEKLERFISQQMSILKDMRDGIAEINGKPANPASPAFEFPRQITERA